MRLQELIARPWGEGLALVAGLVYPLAFAPFEYRFLGWLAIAGLLFSISVVSAKRAFLRGWLWGLGAFLVGISWVYNSMHDFGGAPVAAAVVFTIIFSMYLALYPALAGFVWTKWFVARAGVILGGLAFGLSWAVSEWLRAWVLTGFPWLMFGFAQLDTPFAHLLPFVGAVGSSAVVACSVAWIVLSVQQKEAKGIVGAVALVVLALVAGQVTWVSENGKQLDIALIQGNVPQEMKLKREHLNVSLQAYYELSQPHLDADLIIWPETAMPTYRYAIEPFMQRVAQMTEINPASIFTGIFFKAENGMDYYNAMLEVGGDWQVYKKHQLVPFGEYMPIRWLMRLFSRFVDIPQSDMAAAPLTEEPLVLAGAKVASSICYEMAYPDVLRAQARDAELMINTSNDAWFGDSFAAHQHLEMARTRAKELARPIARATNNGVTAFIDSEGQVLDVAEQFEALSLRDTLILNSVQTPFMRLGQLSVGIVASFVLLLMAIVLNTRSRKKI